MLLDMFSSLDYQFSNLFLLSKMVWLLGVVWLWVLLFNFYFYNNSMTYVFLMVSKLFHTNLESPKNFMFQHMFVLVYSFSFLIIFMNFWSLMPYVYGMTTNLIVGLSFGLSYWLMLQISSVHNHMKSYVSHFVSLGSPLAMAVPLTYSELMKTLVRPGTLTLRLVINMSMGHVIFSLLGVAGANLLFSNFFLGLLMLSMLVFFFLMEICVGVVQSLVFGLLNMKYLGEHT